MIRPTLTLLSKASRVPLTSKGGNKEFSKGTGSFPGLGKKRVGRHGYGKSPYVLMAERMRTFVVPEGLNDCDLQPYVARTSTRDNPKYWVDSWPRADTSSVSSKRGGLYGPNGFDGNYYLQLAEMAERKKNQGDSDY